MTALDQSASDITTFVWGARVLLVLVGVLLVVVLAGAFWVFPVAVAREAVRARRLGDWWAPFVAGQDGRFGPLAQNRWWSVFRAPEHREPAGLAWRWAAWGLTAVLLGVGLLRGVVLAVSLVVHGWR